VSPTLVFDLGGVLLRWRPLEVVRAALPARVHDDASAALWAGQVFQGGGGDWGEFDRGTLQGPDLVQRMTARTRLQETEVQALLRAVGAELQPLADSVTLLQHLHAAGHRLCFLSNMPAPYADRFEAGAAAAATPQDVAASPYAFFRCFAAGVYSSRVRQIKPEPAIFATAQRVFDAAPQALLFLDDHLPNVQAAQAAGWQALHFRGARQARDELRARGLRLPPD
jgi:putative hydrolase of the HAD superfamily